MFTFDIDILPEENTNDINDLKWNNEWKCSSNDDCTAKNSVCSNQLCQCPPEYIFNADMTACVRVATGLYDTCEETVQCSAYLFSGAKCVENVCICGLGSYYLHGRCNRYVGLFEECKQNSDCYMNADFEASVCDVVNGICKCSPGFYQREYRTCRREGKAVGDECTVDIDCTFDNGTCSEFVCAVKSKADKAIELSSDVILIKGILDETTRIGSNCTTDEDCEVVRNAVCGPGGTCHCDRAYFASDTDDECIPELGEPCQNDDVSYIQKSICRDGIWSCTKGTVASKDNRECLNATREYLGNCHVDEQCYIFGPDAICSNNTCVCNENVSHYVESELFCWGNTGINETCNQDRDCYVKDFKGNLTCHATCGCPDGTRLSKDEMSCVGSAELGEACEIDSDCYVPSSVCKKQVCTCAKNYYESHELCLPGINADCTGNEGCSPKNSVCISKKCYCEPNYVAASIDSCIPVSLFGEPCLLDIQCSATATDAICASENRNDTAVTTESSTESSIKSTTESTTAEDKICTCSTEDYYRFGRCFKKKFLGEICTNLGECYESYNEKRIVCRNGKCACIWGYVKLNGTVCVKHSQESKFFLKGIPGSATSVVSMGLFLIVPFVLSTKLF